MPNQQNSVGENVSLLQIRTQSKLAFCSLLTISLTYRRSAFGKASLERESSNKLEKADWS